MEPFQQAYVDVISGPNGFEQTVSHLYLDTHSPALVTVGTGCAISLAEAKTLRWACDGQDVPATPEQVLHGYLMVSHMRPGMVASAYRYPGCLLLPVDQQDLLLEYRIDTATVLLRAMFPEFDQFPECARTGLLEMPFTLGVRAFQVSYPMFRAAVARQDWNAAAAECARNAWDPAFARRNAWLKGMFEKAATEAASNGQG